MFSTYLGGSGDDLDEHISVGQDGNPLVAGITDSPDFPTTSGAPQPDFPGARSVFVTKIDVCVEMSSIGSHQRDAVRNTKKSLTDLLIGYAGLTLEGGGFALLCRL